MYRPKILTPSQMLVERNLDRLGFFSVQSRLPLETTWESHFEVAGRTVHIHGEGIRGRPHGADTDVMLGVQQLFLAADAPDDNWLHTTPNALLKHSLMTKNGRGFLRMREALLRIWSTAYIVREGWSAPSGEPVYFNSAFRLLEELRYWDKDTQDLPEFLPDARLSIRLSNTLADSIRAGFTHTLSDHVLKALEQPHTRALYRLMEANRYQDEGTILKTLQVDLMDWRAACGIYDERPSKVLRTLDAAHSELVDAEYLAEVRVTGRGQKKQIEYVFRQENDPDPALVKLLREHRVGTPRAAELAAKYPERVELAVRYYLQVRREGRVIRNPGGFIADLIANPQKYEVVEAAQPQEAEARHKQRAKQAIEASEVQAEREQEQERLRLERLSPEEQWKEKGGGLVLLLKPGLSQTELKALENKCRSGELLAVPLAIELAKAQAQMTMQEFINGLKGQLG